MGMTGACGAEDVLFDGSDFSRFEKLAKLLESYCLFLEHMPTPAWGWSLMTVTGWNSCSWFLVYSGLVGLCK